MNEKLAKIKKQIQAHAPEIAFGVFLTALVGVYAVYVNKLAEQATRFPEGDSTYLRLRPENIKLMTEEDAWPYYTIDGHRFVIEYVPED